MANSVYIISERRRLVHARHRRANSSSGVLGIVDLGPILLDGMQQLCCAVTQILDTLKGEEEVFTVRRSDCGLFG